MTSGVLAHPSAGGSGNRKGQAADKRADDEHASLMSEAADYEASNAAV